VALTSAEAELAVEQFLDHLRAWLVQQREWPLLMGAADRQTRRRLATIIAREITSIPVAYGEPGVPNRSARRAILRELERDDKRFFEGIDL
jgi:hypothetical protein